MINQVLKVLGITLIVPVVGFAVATHVLHTMDVDALGAVGVDMAYVCAHPDEFGGGQEACGERGLVWTLQLASLVAGAIPLAMIAAQVGLAQWAGRRRNAMAVAFPFLARATIGALVAMVLLQAAVAFGAIWFGESALLGTVHYGIIATLGIGALVAAAGLARAAMASGRRPVIGAVGKILTPDAAPRLHAHVQALARRLGAQPPKHIVVGLDPTFYVTSADVHVVGENRKLEGETLYVSSTLSRLFTPAELDAVIGHELGHFRGDDTVYSLKFAPVYSSLGGAIGGMINGEGRVAWAALPAMHVLALLHELFANAEAAVSRERELEADQAGAEAAGAEALATSLMKVSLHAEAWEAALQEPAFLRDATRANLARAFIEARDTAYDPEAWRKAADEILVQSVAHPIDTHPPVGVRLAALGYDVEGLDIARLRAPVGPSGAAVIDDLEAIEASLSDLERELRQDAFAPSAAQSVLARVGDASSMPH